jgi:hypothetical protein
MNRIFVIFSLLAIITFAFFLGRYMNESRPSMALDNPNSWPDFDRGKYIIDVDKGNSKSALILARYYGSKGITEAAIYWFKKAKQMGDNSVSEELIESCERSVFDQWRN